MTINFLTRPGKPRLAYVFTPGTSDWPPVMFLGGFRSDMSGTKATYFEGQCQKRGQAYLRFDYSGHGMSEGKFEEGTIGQWRDDARVVLEHISPEKNKIVLVGSSMGGWVALLLALENPENLRGLVGVAAAPDFTEKLWSEGFGDVQRREMHEKGFVALPNAYSAEPYIFTKALIEDGKNHCVLDRDHALDIPMRFIQGQKDEDVPWRTALEIEKRFCGADIQVTFIEDGDHRLSRQQDLELIDREIQELSR